MQRCVCRISTLAWVGFAILAAAAAQAAPSDAVMPLSTRGFASVADLADLESRWRQTQMGQLAADEAMQPFIQDMRAQLERKLDGARDKLGLTVADLKEVAAGELGIGLIERRQGRAALAVTVDVTGRGPQARQLLGKIDAELSKRRATRSNVQEAGTTIVVYQIPPRSADDLPREAAFFLHQDLLVACDNRLETVEMLRRVNGAGGDGLADLAAYQQSMKQCSGEAGRLTPDLRWFVDPFGYARAARSLARVVEESRGRDYLNILQSQGFDAVQGIGGFVNLAVEGRFELLHRTAVIAPPNAAGDQKYKLAMQIMKFPNGQELKPEPWMPRKLASYRTFNWDLQNAYRHVGTLVDAMAGYEDAFRDMIEGLETDPYGPKIKVHDEFIQHLGGRVTLITDYDLPITTKSERYLFVVELKNQAAMEQVVQKYMEADPNAHRRELDGLTVWEILPPESDVPELDLDVEPVGEPVGGGAGGGPKALATSAVCVQDGRLFVASHLQFLQSVLDSAKNGQTLSAAGDFHEVDAALNQLSAGPVAARCFVRTDEAYRPTYELLRQGKMPESETLLGRLLNRLLTTQEDEYEGVLRKQKIDGRQLPQFEMVRRYFSPAGTVVRSNDDGWFIVGATLTKQSPQARAGAARPGAGDSALR